VGDATILSCYLEESGRSEVVVRALEEA